MKDCSCKDEEMPDKMIVFLILYKWNHSYGINHASKQNHCHQWTIMIPPVWEKHKSAPSDYKIQGKMEPSEPSWSKNANRRDSKQDQSPLHTK